MAETQPDRKILKTQKDILCHLQKEGVSPATKEFFLSSDFPNGMIKSENVQTYAEYIALRASTLGSSSIPPFVELPKKFDKKSNPSKCMLDELEEVLSEIGIRSHFLENSPHPFIMLSYIETE